VTWATPPSRGDIVSPKSVTPGRITANIDIFGFEPRAGDLEAVSALNKGQRTGPDPDRFGLIDD
jgi:2,5-diketo-D-gluconate reductase A